MPSRPPAAQTPKRGGTLNTILQPSRPLIVPGLNNQGPTWIISPKIFQGLLRYSADLKPLPNLAKSWTVSDDGKTYTFKLQENVKWHDARRSPPTTWCSASRNGTWR
ncbi:MAG: ABC transporter substrate-binding protein [Pseudomonadota bacterium]